MKKQALGIIIIVVVLVTVFEAGCTRPTTQNNIMINNVSKKSNDSARFPTPNNITAQFNTMAGNASKTFNSTTHEVRVVVHFLNGLMKLVNDTTRDLHSSTSGTFISVMTSFSLQRKPPFL
ncbi:MAG TPA: hypothetical protein VEG44_07185 [Candidatus Acidoferrales bacterium]|nr:hypothetical protein [Candidatus Acidoferrales bacterium]